MTDTPEQAAEQQAREVFEREHAGSHNSQRFADGSHDYVSYRVQVEWVMFWMGWQARAALSAAQPEPAWRPIETAKGKGLFGWQDDGHCVIVDDAEIYLSNLRHCRFSLPDGWMPLPAPLNAAPATPPAQPVGKPVAPWTNAEVAYAAANAAAPYKRDVYSDIFNAFGMGVGWARKRLASAAALADERDARQELRNISEAKRFDRDRFDDDTAFADWAQSRARYALQSNGG